METFKIKKEAESILMKNSILYLACYYTVLALIFKIFLKDYDLGFQKIGLICLLIFISILIGLKVTKTFLKSYSITFSDNSITRIQQNLPLIEINKNEISEIVKFKNGGFVIKGKNKNEAIGIHYMIENNENLEKMLSDIMPITYNEENVKSQYLSWLLLAIFTLLIIYSSISKNETIKYAAGISMVSYLFYQTSKASQEGKIGKYNRFLKYLFAFALLSIVFNILITVFMKK